MDTMRKATYASLIVLFCALILYTYTMRYRRIEQPAPPDLGCIPTNVAGYSGTDEYLEPASLQVLGSDASLFRTYAKHGVPPIWFFLGYFGAQQEYSQIHSPKNCYPGSGWNITDEGSIELAIAQGTIDARKLLISDGRERRMVIYWFSTPEGALGDEFALKWYQAKSSMLGRPQVSTFVRFSTVVPEGAESEVEKRMRDFIQSLGPLIGAALGSEPRKGSSHVSQRGTLES